MIVITADQINSRSTPDAVGAALAELNAEGSPGLTLPADRTAGDEIQMVAASGSDALAIILGLTRSRQWSVGCGVGAVREPLAAGVRESSGDAFVAARAAVDLAKKRPTRFALAAAAASPAGGDAEALIDLLLALRDRRSAEGWELHDLLESGMTQAEAAARLGITPQAASKRKKAAELRGEQAALGPLARLLDGVDRVDNRRGQVGS